MDISAVSNKSVRRDLEVFAGRAETISLTVYPVDDVLQTAVDMTGETLTLKVFPSVGYVTSDYSTILPSTAAILTIEATEGTISTFAITPSNTERLKGRYNYMITDGDAVSTYGAFTVK